MLSNDAAVCLQLKLIKCQALHFLYARARAIFTRLSITQANTLYTQIAQHVVVATAALKHLSFS